MQEREYFTADSYKSIYIPSDAFEKCREMVRGKKCFICEGLYRILPHHVRYDNLYHERIWKDIYPICYFDHIEAHFMGILWIMEYKLPLKRFVLKKRIFYLRLKYCIRKRKIWASIWALIYCLFV